MNRNVMTRGAVAAATVFALGLSMASEASAACFWAGKHGPEHRLEIGQSVANLGPYNDKLGAVSTEPGSRIRIYRHINFDKRILTVGKKRRAAKRRTNASVGNNASSLKCEGF